VSYDPHVGSLDAEKGRGGARSLGCRLIGLSMLLLPGSGLLGGCAYNAENIVRRTTPAAIEETLEALNDPGNQALIRDLVDDEAVKAAVAELAEAMTSGALDGLSDEERASHLTELSARLVERLVAAAGEGIRDELTPSVQSMVERTVESAIERSLSAETRKRAQALAAGVAREAAAAMVSSSSERIRRDLGPALAGVIDDDLTPALERALAQRLIPAIAAALEAELEERAKPAIAGLSREVAKQMVLGVDDALVELDIVDPELRRALLQDLNADLNRGIRFAEVLAWVFAALALLLALFLVRTLLRARSLRQHSEQIERAMATIVRRIRLSDRDDGWIDDIVDMVDMVDTKLDLKGMPSAPADAPAASAGQARERGSGASP